MTPPTALINPEHVAFLEALAGILAERMVADLKVPHDEDAVDRDPQEVAA